VGIPPVQVAAGFILKLGSGNTITNTLPYFLATSLSTFNTGFRKLIYHAPNSNAAPATVNVINTSGTTLTTYTIDQGSNVSLLWLGTQWLQLA
jgi:hypothetical protein